MVIAETYTRFIDRLPFFFFALTILSLVVRKEKKVVEVVPEVGVLREIAEHQWKSTCSERIELGTHIDNNRCIIMCV